MHVKQNRCRNKHYIVYIWLTNTRPSDLAVLDKRPNILGTTVARGEAAAWSGGIQDAYFVGVLQTTLLIGQAIRKSHRSLRSSAVGAAFDNEPGVQRILLR